MCRAVLVLAAVLAVSVTVRAGPAVAETPDEEAALRPYVPPPAPRPADWPRERLAAFMRELADFVYEHHVVRDEGRKTYGMTYEFYADGKWMQEFGLDSMHDGAWFMSAMATAHRADPAGGYIERVQKYQVPFYANMLTHSDRLFPGMRPTDEDVKPFERPVKGWVPRGWDDGAGYRKSGQRLLEGYDTSSNHLAQDLANLPLNVWLTTADPALARAVMDLEDYKLACFGPISVIEYAAGVMNARPDLFRKYTASAFTPLSLNPCTSGMVQQNGAAIPAYSDDLAWQYRSATAGCFLAGTMPEDAVLSGAAQAYASALAMEMYFDRGLYPYGMYLFDIQGPVRFVRGGGRLDAYVSDSKKIFGARGIQFAWVGAGVLPHLAKHPDLWERLYREKHASEPLVRIVDVPPKTDGRKDRVYEKSQPLADGKTVVTLLADPKNLHVFLESAEAELTVEIRPAGPVSGDVPAGRFTAAKDGRITATDARGGPLLHRAAFVAGDPWAAELRVPFGVVRGQAHFINGLDHGRYEVRVGGGPAQTVYMLSEPSRIIDRLEALALGTIATWHDVWKKTGIIPSGYHPVEDRRARSWEISDAGNYAHLIHAVALWMIYQQGQSEWEIIRRDFPKEPLRAPPLPDSVLRAQGLK